MGTPERKEQDMDWGSPHKTARILVKDFGPNGALKYAKKMRDSVAADSACRVHYGEAHDIIERSIREMEASIMAGSRDMGI